jgi:adenosylcobinamide-phosphate synthase
VSAFGLDTAAIAAGAVILARFADSVVSEPPMSVHPVAWFGRLVAPVDREWPAPRFIGAVAALLLPLFAGVVVGSVVHAGSFVSPLLTGLLAGTALFVCVSLEMLLTETAAVVTLSRENLDGARQRLRSLAGRDASELSAAEVRSAAVESVAENLADGLVAPLLAFVLGATVSLPVAAALAAWVKAVNTMDSMLGYRSKPVGWAAATLDDAVMFVPARLTAAVVAVTATQPDSVVTARPVARLPDSPNSGWPMATLAEVLDCRLRKSGAYDLFPDRSLPDAETAENGIAVTRRAGEVSFLLTAICAGLFAGSVTGLDPFVVLSGGGSWF